VVSTVTVDPGVSMSNELEGRRIAFLVANEGVEQVELTEPWEAVRAAGATPILVTPDGKPTQAMNHLDKGDQFDADLAVGDANAEDFAALVLPGGVANPDQLRTDEGALSFVRAFTANGLPVAAICHAPWTLVEADVLNGRTLTSWPSLRTDVTNAGGTWVDQEVVVDEGPGWTLVTSRKPDDLPAFCDALVAAAAP
jgi:protease I